jgi:hypothetical protein
MNDATPLTPSRYCVECFRLLTGGWFPGLVLDSTPREAGRKKLGIRNSGNWQRTLIICFFVRLPLDEWETVKSSWIEIGK